jgi:CheY-like chemotaxis protein
MKASGTYILLADDNADDQSFIRDAFSYIKAGITIKIVDSGVHLIEHLDLSADTELPSLIVLDYNMPELNGAEVLELLSQKPRYAGIPKLMLSTSFFKKHIDHCLKLGANGYLIKPDNFFDWKLLAHKILTYINPGEHKSP